MASDTPTDPDESSTPEPVAPVVPSDPGDPEVVVFLALHGLKGPAVHLDYAPGPYGEDWCHVSAKHRAMTEGGRRVHGWALWNFDGIVVGDHHSVWEPRPGMLIDVTPPKYGETRVLFVRDDSAVIERNGDNFFIRTNPTSIPQMPFLWKGLETEFTHVPFPLSKPDLVAYCAGLGIEPTAILTDKAHG
jgi:hypothetical protein